MSWGFVNPPNMATWNDFTDNPIYVEGSSVNLVWQAPEDVTTSVTLYHVNLTDGNVIGNFEYITRSVVNLTSFEWRVGSSKDMDISNVFMMSMYVEGGTEIKANSHYFNISSKSTDSGSSTTSSTSVSSSATSSTSVSLNLPTSTGSSSETATSAAATTSSPAASSSGLSQGAMIGMGVAIPCAVILGIAAGWFFFGRRRKNQQPKPVDHAPDSDSTAPAMSMVSPGQSRHSNAYTGTTQNGQFYGAVPQQGSPPVEMHGQMQNKPAELHQGWSDYELSGESRPGMGPHYELYAQVPDGQRQDRYT